MPLEQLRHREDRADAHLVGLAAGHRDAAVNTERFEAAFFGEARLHYHGGRCAVGQLARIACRDAAVLTHRTQAGQAVKRCRRAIAFIFFEHDVFERDFL